MPRIRYSLYFPVPQGHFVKAFGAEIDGAEGLSPDTVFHQVQQTHRDPMSIDFGLTEACEVDLTTSEGLLRALRPGDLISAHLPGVFLGLRQVSPMGTTELFEHEDCSLRTPPLTPASRAQAEEAWATIEGLRAPV